MKLLAALFIGVAFGWNKEYTLREIESDAFEARATFEAWAKAFNRSYKTVNEEAERYLRWRENLHIIASYNSKDLSFKLRLNQFGDMSKDEFRHYVHGDKGACYQDKSDILNSHGQDNPEIIIEGGEVRANPSSVDWSTKGVVTPIKNQGQCGSCWAFSTTGAIECDYAIKNGVLNSLSEQELVDCAGLRYDCDGCNGGQMTGGLQYAANNGGLCLESQYKYTARDGTCKSSTCGTKYDASSGYDPVKKDDSAALETAVVSGCVSIGIEADQTAFQYYSSGVLTGNCGTSIDHGVLVVGYGTEGENQYWKVKNSWGSSWGEEGYVKICRNCGKNGNKGECGILTGPNVPTFK